jgi:hypothetical protein
VRSRWLILVIVWLVAGFFLVDTLRHIVVFQPSPFQMLVVAFCILMELLGCPILLDHLGNSRKFWTTATVILLSGETAWIGSSFVAPWEKYPIVLGGTSEGTYAVITDGIFAPGKKIIAIPKWIGLDKKFAVGIPRGVFEWEVVANLELDVSSASSVRRKVEFLRKYGVLLLPYPEEKVEKEFEQKMNNFFIANYGKLLQAAMTRKRWEEIDIPRYEILGYRINELKISPPKMIKLSLPSQ